MTAGEMMNGEDLFSFNGGGLSLAFFIAFAP